MISHLATRGECCAEARYPAEKVLDLVAAVRPPGSRMTRGLAPRRSKRTGGSN